MTFITTHPEVILWLLGVLGGTISALLIYIWIEHQKKDREDREADNQKIKELSSAFTTAFSKMEDKLERAVKAMEDTAEAMGKGLTEKINIIENRLDARIDSVEKKQTKHCADITRNTEQIKAVVAVCRERASHCPSFNHATSSPHFFTRVDDIPPAIVTDK